MATGNCIWHQMEAREGTKTRTACEAVAYPASQSGLIGVEHLLRCDKTGL